MVKDRTPQSLADQLRALADQGHIARPAQRAKPHDVRPTGIRVDRPMEEPDVSDFEREMLARDAQSRKVEAPTIAPGESDPRYIKGRRHVVQVTRIVRPPRREMDPARVPIKAVPTRPLRGATLTAAAAARFALPEPASKATIEASAKAAPKSVTEEGHASVPSSPAQARPKKPKGAFRLIREIVQNSNPKIEPRADKMARKAIEAIADNIALGSQLLAKRPDFDEKGYLVGFDFGTSSAKVVFHQPYAADEPLAAMEAPKELRSQGHPYLWQTVVWFLPSDGSFSLWPRDGAIALEGFKTGIIARLDGQRIHEEYPVTRADAATAFLALHMAHLTGWYQNHRPLGPVGGDSFLSFNFGIPTATNDDQIAFGIFNRIINAARVLATDCIQLTLGQVQDVYRKSEAVLPNGGYQVIPELCAALMGYSNLPSSYRGAHVLVDVGASTLDIVAFNLVEQQGKKSIAAFGAGVELLGAAALETAREHEVEDRIFRSACDHQFNTVYKRACEPQMAPGCFKPNLRGNKHVQLVVTGGGSATDVHSAFVEAMPSGILGEQKIERSRPPKHIASKRCDISRLLLAYGLAKDHPDIPGVTLPSNIPPLIAADQADRFPEMITKDQV